MRNNTIRLLFIYFTAIIITSGCSKEKDEVLPTEPVPIELTSSQVKLIDCGNSFSFDIFRKIAEAEDQSVNLIISPLSISYALSMTMNGASGPTREAMINTLKLSGITPDDINNSFKDLTQALLNVDKRVLISLANSVWTEDDFQVKQQFIEILTKYYDAESKQFDINDASAPAKINKWIEDNTNGLIKDMVDKLDPATKMLLINAIYFKGKWSSQFDPDATAANDFSNQDATVKVPTMHQTGKFRIYKGSGFTLAEFPYGQKNFVMDILLPDSQSNLGSVIASTTSSSFDGWISQLQERETDVSLPKFKYDYKKKLKEILSDLGMGVAFSDFADFSNISEVDLKINDVTHQAFIETNEEGTEAAAATVVEIKLTSAPMAFTFRADHPFIYIIRETTTNTVLFMGRLSDPLAD